MPDSWDGDLQKTAETPPIEPLRSNRSPGVWAAGAALVVAAGVAAYFLFGARQAPEPATTGAPAAAVPIAAAPSRPLGADVPDPIDVPPLDQSDVLVRELVSKLTAHPRVGAWLVTRGLIRNFTVVVSNIAEGKTPAVHLTTLRPATSFAVIERSGYLEIDPKSYERYATIADAFASIDPAGGARLYTTLKPRIEEAYRDLGFPDTPFDSTLEQAIVLLLETPLVNAPMRVEPQGATGYGFAEARLEALTDAQKHLLRMGPRNVRMIQAALRVIALELGIRVQRLPAPRA